MAQLARRRGNLPCACFRFVRICAFPALLEDVTVESSQINLRHCQIASISGLYAKSRSSNFKCPVWPCKSSGLLSASGYKYWRYSLRRTFSARFTFSAVHIFDFWLMRWRPGPDITTRRAGKIMDAKRMLFSDGHASVPKSPREE